MKHKQKSKPVTFITSDGCRTEYKTYCGDKVGFAKASNLWRDVTCDLCLEYKPKKR